MPEDSTVAPVQLNQIDGSVSLRASHVLSVHSPAAEVNCHMEDNLREINRLIDELEAKSAGFEDLKEEADLALQQLQDAQVQLEEQSLAFEEQGRAFEEQSRALKESKEENELILFQLHQVQEELETVFLDGREKESKLKFNRRKCARLESEVADIRGEADLFRRNCVRLESEVADIRGEADLFRRQLHRVQEELEFYFVDNQRKEEKLAWLRGQRELLIRMLRLQARVQIRFGALDARIALPAMIRQAMPWWKRLQRS
jgi:chromosome segregation ATPase